MILCLLVPTLVVSQDGIKTYKVHRTDTPVDITGKGTAKQWENVKALTDFVYPWRNQEAPWTEFKAMWDDNQLYFRYRVKDNEIITPERGMGEKDVINSDRVEIFFKADDEMNPYYPLEMDAKGRYFDAEGKFYRNINMEWQWPKEHISVKAYIEKDGYILEGSISLESLRRHGLYKDDGILRAGLYRGEYFTNAKNETEVGWISWVIPSSESPDFHIPSSFGILELVDH